jgi:hypothetical protein
MPTSDGVAVGQPSSRSGGRVQTLSVKGEVAGRDWSQDVVAGAEVNGWASREKGDSYYQTEPEAALSS